MTKRVLSIPAEDLDEASIYLYRLWSFHLLGVHPRALVLKGPEYIVLADEWALYASKSPISEQQIADVASDTGLRVLCACPSRQMGSAGLDVTNGRFEGTVSDRAIVEALAQAAAELPPAAKNRDPELGRWQTESYGAFQLYESAQCRLICVDSAEKEFGYTWSASKSALFFYRSKSCKRQGRLIAEGRFQLAEQKLERGKSVWNLDLLDAGRCRAALLRLAPVGAGYKVFCRQIPTSFSPIPTIVNEGD